MNLIYMDHGATTPVDVEVFEKMKPYFCEMFGNPSSVYSLGQKSKHAIEEARNNIANLLNASSDEIYFTSGGTEANNQAIISYMLANRHKGNHFITSMIEHPAVLETCKYLEKNGFEITLLPVDQYGLVSKAELKNAIKNSTSLVSIMHSNNEIGTIQPIRELVEIAHEAGSAFHTDAVQSMGKILVDVKELGVDLLSASSHKLYGPKGIGCLYIKKKTKIEKFIHGGSQERNLRSGTENVSGIVGFGEAARLAKLNLKSRNDKINNLTKQLQDTIIDNIPDTFVTGHPDCKLPGVLSLCFKYIEGESIILMLDAKGIMASSGSACTSGALEPSHVLRAIGLPHEIAHGSLRLTLGKDNTEKEIKFVANTLIEIVNKLREMSPLFLRGGE
ncbi:Cysteine desulfurase [Candidatus Syntrophocurvum alkaliphilum]|uniref:Cysteine desulfurase n=1 Tax=Candidatus Syntrophocurvum alkaliphilum TaxID=2293317 RepID=A0A6I6D8W2_9FIRM|nr:cysteine desulfurase NifS [Candidatus Syntrophocurvum alkaliphilum]QGT99378.1 Cysteine desulfurase [Candidatus Syntrophocurvum alkaliphilum]